MSINIGYPRFVSLIQLFNLGKNRGKATIAIDFLLKNITKYEFYVTIFPMENSR